jgi:hypothetical protein
MQFVFLPRQCIQFSLFMSFAFFCGCATATLVSFLYNAAAALTNPRTIWLSSLSITLLMYLF